MKVVKRIFLFLFLIILVSSIFFIYKELKPKKPESIKEDFEESIQEESLLPQSQEEQVSIQEEPTTSELTPSQDNLKTPKLLFENILLYPEIDYPFIYAYDPESKTIKEINIENKTYKEFYKADNIQALYFSEDKTKILFKKSKDYYLLDITNDKLEKLPKIAKKAFWVRNNLYVYILTSESSYIAQFNKGIQKFLDIYILNPDFEILNEGILVYENLKHTYSSPLILIDKNKRKRVLLEGGINLSIISNKKDLIFASLFEKAWKSYLIDNNGNKLKEFNFGTLKEKCTFDKLLICGVPKNQNILDPTKWYYYKENFEDRVVIFDPQKNILKYLDLNGKYDILKPTITPLGLIFLNRFNNKLYVIPVENFSF